MYKPGDVVVYTRGDVIELGVVKYMRDENTAFVAYHAGDTVAATNISHLHIVENGYALPALAERMKQLGAFTFTLSPDCEDWSEFRYETHNSSEE